jgi:hypothetical protein
MKFGVFSQYSSSIVLVFNVTCVNVCLKCIIYFLKLLLKLPFSLYSGMDVGKYIKNNTALFKALLGYMGYIENSVAPHKSSV